MVHTQTGFQQKGGFRVITTQDKILGFSVFWGVLFDAFYVYSSQTTSHPTHIDGPLHDSAKTSWKYPIVMEQEFFVFREKTRTNFHKVSFMVMITRKSMPYRSEKSHLHCSCGMSSHLAHRYAQRSYLSKGDFMNYDPIYQTDDIMQRPTFWWVKQRQFRYQTWLQSFCTVLDHYLSQLIVYPVCKNK